MRYPVIHQQNATDCGPAALATIAAFYGGQISPARIRDYAGTDSRGTTLAGLSVAAEEIGLRTHAVRARRETLALIKLPAIAHWRENDRGHFVVLFRTTRKRVVLADPAIGIRKLSCTDFHRNWTGVLLLVTPTVRFRRVRAAKSPLSRLSRLLPPHHHLILDALIAAVLMTILGLTTSFFIQALVDSVCVLGRTPTLNWLDLGLLLVTFSRAGVLGLRPYLIAHLSHRIEAATVLGYYRHLLGLPLPFFRFRGEGEILSKNHAAIRPGAGATGKPRSTDGRCPNHDNSRNDGVAEPDTDRAHTSHRHGSGGQEKRTTGTSRSTDCRAARAALIDQRRRPRTTIGLSLRA